MRELHGVVHVQDAFSVHTGVRDSLKTKALLFDTVHIVGLGEYIEKPWVSYQNTLMLGRRASEELEAEIEFLTDHGLITDAPHRSKMCVETYDRLRKGLDLPPLTEETTQIFLPDFVTDFMARITSAELEQNGIQSVPIVKGGMALFSKTGDPAP